MMPLLSSLLLWMGGPSALASKSEAKACLSTQVNEAYLHGWRVRGSNAYDIAANDAEYYMTALSAAMDYLVVSCGDAEALSFAHVIYDDQGRLVKEAPSTSRQLNTQWRPNRTGTYFVGVRIKQTKTTLPPEDPGRKRRNEEAAPAVVPMAGMGLAIMYR